MTSNSANSLLSNCIAAGNISSLFCSLFKIKKNTYFFYLSRMTYDSVVKEIISYSKYYFDRNWQFNKTLTVKKTLSIFNVNN